MPTLYKSHGLRIVMNPRGREHNPPHVHVYYKDDLAIIEIRTCKIIEGYVPSKGFQEACRFIENNREKLIKSWETKPQLFLEMNKNEN